jgi:putative GTP pyrophosphokinase
MVGSGVGLMGDSATHDAMVELLMQYKFAIDEVMTKVRILDEEFRYRHAYNPIEHVSSRLKSADSIRAKAKRKGVPASARAIRDAITDIAGVRVVCSFTSDVHHLLTLLAGQHDLRVREVKDYIAEPKPNGYRSLHVLVEVPVFLSSGPVIVPVEIQLRTTAMDFWASLEHKIHYKYEGEVPQDLLDGLAESAATAARLDSEMEVLHGRMRRYRAQTELWQTR